MPIFLSEEEFQSCSHDSSLVAEKADAFIKELLNQLETVKAEAEAASITALQQKYFSLSLEFSSLQSQHSQSNVSKHERVSLVTQLQSVLREMEEKAAVILDERAEHERMLEAYSALNQKLQQCLTDQSTSNRQIRELKAGLRWLERNYAAAEKEIIDLRNQVTVLLKECQDIQLRCGFSCQYNSDALRTTPSVPYDSGNVIPEQLTFKDIAGLVEQNVQLRRLVHSLYGDIENRETELKEKYEKEIQKHKDEDSSKVDAILVPAEEQGHMIKSLQTSVAMYKKLYEEEHKFHSSHPKAHEVTKGKKITGYGASEQMMKEKKEQDARMLEKIVEMLKDEHKTEKDNRTKLQKAVVEYPDFVLQERSKILDELTKNNQALKILTDVKTLKMAKCSRSEILLTARIQEISLLRASNQQLIEENRHSIEECKKLRESLQIARIESENLGKSLEQSQNDVRAYKEEIERQKMEKGDLAKRLDQVSVLRKSFEQSQNDVRAYKEEIERQKMEKEDLAKRLDQVSVLRKSLEQSQNDVRAYKEEIERQKMEKEDLANRLDQLLERYKNFDVEDHHRLQAVFEEMQVNLREKEARLAEAMKLCSEKEDVISHLEQELAGSRIELNERESRINEFLQAEATLRSEIDEQKRMIAHFMKKSENLMKEKEDLGKENHVLSKQLDYARHGKKITGDGAGEQTMKEKTKEKDTRIQMLEKTVERLKGEHKMEKDKRTKMQKTVVESGDSVLQIQEISLLRESNLQQREENRHNFEECQKLCESLQIARIESENSGKSLKQSPNDGRAYKEEIERQKMEKEDLAKRLDQLLERYKNFDVEDHHSLQAVVEEMQVNVREKEAQLAEAMELCSVKEDVISHLEHNLARSRIELNERESRINEILQAEATLRSEVDEQKRMIAQFKKKSENLTKEKDDLGKENQVLSKQWDDAGNGKKIIGDGAGEQTMKEKEKEKDTRIQMLEKTVERLKDEHKTENDKRTKMQKTVVESRDSVLQQQSKILDELEKHKQALKILTDDVETLKMGKGSKSEIQEISLLRESNLQLSEENRHNCEECQKPRESLQIARIESENLGKSLEQSQNDVRAYKGEIEKQKMQKEDLAKRLDQLLERHKNFDVEDHHRLQAVVEKMQVNLREKEARLAEAMKLCSEKEDVISPLEQDPSRSRIELNERESRINEILRAQVARPVLSAQPGAAAAESLSSMHMTSPGATADQVISSIEPTSSLAAPSAANVPAVKTLDKKEKKFVSPKANFEARKTGRKLVRPRILKAEVEGSDSSTRPLSHSTIETQGTPMLQAPLVRKRLSSPSTLDLQGSIFPGETSSDVTEPAQKKPKN